MREVLYNTPSLNKMENVDTFPYDSIVTAMTEKMKSRARFGKHKYGTDLDRKDLTTKDWIVHVQEELMDALLYLEKLKVELGERSEPS